MKISIQNVLSGVGIVEKRETTQETPHSIRPTTSPEYEHEIYLPPTALNRTDDSTNQDLLPSLTPVDDFGEENPPVPSLGPTADGLVSGPAGKGLRRVGGGGASNVEKRNEGTRR